MTEDDVLKPFSAQALLRYAAVSLVHARLLAGEERGRAIEQVASMEHATASGGLQRVSTRSIQRWLLRYEEGGMGALEDKPRKSSSASRVLSPELLAYLAAERKKDRKASIPELLCRAKEEGLLTTTSDVDRTTVYRALVRMPSLDDIVPAFTWDSTADTPGSPCPQCGRGHIVRHVLSPAPGLDPCSRPRGIDSS